MIEDYHFIYSQWNGLLHICLPEPPSTTPGVMHRKFGLKNPSDVQPLRKPLVDGRSG